jgi:hypothetical protein
MVYALLMLLALGALRAAWTRSVYQVPLVVLAGAATAWAFISDITTVLSISL